jgi:peroxiredoxin (alkyl hydroperoxide reductase subunit C)
MKRCTGSVPQIKPQAKADGMANIGQQAPEFEAPALVGGQSVTVRLSQYLGDWLILFFYTKDDTGVCTSEHTAFRTVAPDFEQLGARILAVSVDSLDSHRRWQDSNLGAVPYAWLADESKDIARSYGVLHEDTGLALRATFIIDPDSIVRYISVHDLAIGRNTDEVLRTLQALQSGKMTQCNWKPGEPPL